MASPCRKSSGASVSLQSQERPRQLCMASIPLSSPGPRLCHNVCYHLCHSCCLCYNLCPCLCNRPHSVSSPSDQLTQTCLVTDRTETCCHGDCFSFGMPFLLLHFIVTCKNYILRTEYLDLLPNNAQVFLLYPFVT